MLTWDVPVLADGLSFQVTGMQFETDIIGRTEKDYFYLTETEEMTRQGVMVWAMLNDGSSFGLATNGNLNIVADAPTSAAEDFYMEWKETADTGVFRALTSRVPDTYPVLRVALCDDPDDIDEYRTQSCFAEDGGKASLYFRDRNDLCTLGFYSLWGGTDYTLSDGDNTLHYHMTLLRDWTPCSTETPHDHVWTTATEQSWLLPKQSVCSRCGLLRIDEACLRDEALQTLTYTEAQSEPWMREGETYYRITGTYRDAQQVIYTEEITCRSDGTWVELYAWNGASQSNAKRFCVAEYYDRSDDDGAYVRLGIREFDANFRLVRENYYRISDDSIKKPNGWDADFVYDDDGNLLSYKSYEAHGHNAWNYENTYYPNGVRATYRMLDPDNGNACVRERCFTAEGELWKFMYDFNGELEIQYFGDYSEQNPYVYSES